MTIKKIVRKCVFTLVLLVFIISSASGIYMLHITLVPHNRGKDELRSQLTMYERYPFLVPWMVKLKNEHALKDTFIVNNQKIRLHAYYVWAPHPTNKTAIIVHGYMDNAMRMMMIGYMYQHDLGFNILLPDLQYHGRSGGNTIQMGWKDRLDVIQWINVARRIFGKETNNTSIVVHGISMGAATTMCVSGEPLPKNVRCFVEDCGYTSVWDEFSAKIKDLYGIPPFPVLYAANFYCNAFYQWNFFEASPLNAIRNCYKPMLFIHGSKDTFVPTAMLFTLYNAKPAPKERWICPGAVHARSYLKDRKTYTLKVRNFVNKYMN